MANLVEGSRRIDVVGKVALKIGAASLISGILLWIYTFFVIRHFSGTALMASRGLAPASIFTLQLWGGFGMILLVAGFWLVALGGVACLVAWIVSGFGVPPSARAS